MMSMALSGRAQPVVVIAEAGSGSGTWIQACQERPELALVISQQSLEEPLAFADRALQRVARLGATAPLPAIAVLAVCRTASLETLNARALLAFSLVRSLRETGGGELLLAADCDFSATARHELFGLMQELAQAAIGSSIAIRVNFGTPRGARRPDPARNVQNLTPAVSQPRMSRRVA